MTPLKLGLFHPKSAEQDLSAIGHPRWGGVVPVAIRELTNRATIRRHDEDVRVISIHIAHPIPPIIGALHHLGCCRPGGAGRGGGHADVPVPAIGDACVEGDACAIGRPGNGRWGLVQTRDLARGPLVIHPTDEDLVATRLARSGKGDACPVGRPEGARALGQEALPASIGVHDPDFGAAAVGPLVCPGAGVDHLTPIGRDLGIGHRLHLPVHLQIKEARTVLTGNGRGKDR